MPLTEFDLYKICHGTYETSYVWDYLFQGGTDDEAYIGIKLIDKAIVIACRGSVTALDWARNFDPAMIHDQSEGWIDQGFNLSVPVIAHNISYLLPGKIIYIVGHSRGAGIAVDLAAKLIEMGYTVRFTLLLAPPRTGLDRQKQLLAGTSAHAYRNVAEPPDPVTQVPPWCECPFPLIEIHEPAPEDDEWLVVRSHHSELYGAAIEKLDPMPVYPTE